MSNKINNMINIINNAEDKVNISYLERIVDYKDFHFLVDFPINLTILPTDKEKLKELVGDRLTEGHDAMCEFVNNRYDIYIDVTNEIDFISLGVKILHELCHIETHQNLKDEIKYDKIDLELYSEYYSNSQSLYLFSKFLQELETEIEEDYTPEFKQEIEFLIGTSLEKINSGDLSLETIGYFLGSIQILEDKSRESIYKQIKDIDLVDSFKEILDKLELIENKYPLDLSSL